MSTEFVLYRPFILLTNEEDKCMHTNTQTHRHVEARRKTSVCHVFIGASVTHGVGLGVVGGATAVFKLGVQGPPRNQE